MREVDYVRYTDRLTDDLNVRILKDGDDPELYEDMEHVNDCYERLGDIETLFTNADTVRLVSQDGIVSLHLDMILDADTLPIVEKIFKKR